MSLFGKDFLKEGGADQGKSDFEANSQFYFSQDPLQQYAGEGSYGGLSTGTSSQGGYGFPPGYAGGAGHQAAQQQQSRLGGLPNNQPLFNRTANPQVATRPTSASAAPGLGAASGLLGLGGSNNTSASSTPSRAGLAGSAVDLSRFNVAGGAGASRGLGGNNFGIGGGDDDLMGNVMANIAGLNDGGDDFGTNGSSIFGASGAENSSSSSLLGGRSAGSSLLGGNGGSLGAIGGGSSSGGHDLLSSLAAGGNGSQSSGFLSNLAASTGGLGAVGSSLTSSSVPPSSKDSKYGLLGLLNDVLRAQDKDSQQLSLGTDLTTFGLNLSASENLYPTFISPFTENMLDEKPYKVPGCYLAPTATLKAEHITKFQVETLFYMFYLMPKDVFQSLAALELYRREWRYHGELKVWLKQRTQQEMLQAHPQVQFVYFDPKSFEARLFNAAGRGNLSAGIVSEEDIRARISPAALASVTSGSNAMTQQQQQQQAAAGGAGAAVSSLPGMLGGNAGGGLTLGGDSS